MNMSVLERQRAARWKWELQDDRYLPEFSGAFPAQAMGRFPAEIASCDSMLTGATIDPQMTPDPSFDCGWPDFGRVEFPPLGFGPCGYGDESGPEMNFALSRTSSCPPAIAAATLSEKRSGSVASEKMSSAGFKKRKAEGLQKSKTVVKDEARKTRGCGGAEEDSKITEENANNSGKSCNKKEITSGASKESCKVSEVQKPDYIHVRARRGQATDSHSLAERLRREKISERMKFLQDLVPGCNKITGKAGMLDEIINYVQSLQQQVEFLSMKLAAVNSRLDFDTDNILAKEMFRPSSANFQTLGMLSEIANPAYAQFNQVQQVVSRSGLEVGIQPPDMGLRISISAPVSVPDAFLEPSCFPQIHAPAPWDAGLQNLYSMVYDQGKSAPSSSLPFAGLVEAGNLKAEI